MKRISSEIKQAAPKIISFHPFVVHVQNQLFCIEEAVSNTRNSVFYGRPSWRLIGVRSLCGVPTVYRMDTPRHEGRAIT